MKINSYLPKLVSSNDRHSGYFGLTWLVLFISIMSCSTDVKKGESTKQLSKILSDIQKSSVSDINFERISYICIIPLKNCNDCSLKTINSIKLSYNEDNMIYILTGYDSKVLKSKIEVYGLTGNTVLIDDQNRFLKSGYLKNKEPVLLEHHQSDWSILF